MEFLKDYDFEVKYHLGKANIVADALSRKFLHVASLTVREWDLIEKFRNLNLTVTIGLNKLGLNHVRIENDFRKQIIEGQKIDQVLQAIESS